LDLEACVWLARPLRAAGARCSRAPVLQEGYLKEYKKCLVLVSHSQDFLNGVCTHIIWLTHSKLTYYTGNYDTYCKTVAENEIIQMKKYLKEQEGELTATVCTAAAHRAQTSSTSRTLSHLAAPMPTSCARPSRSKKSWTRCTRRA